MANFVPKTGDALNKLAGSNPLAYQMSWQASNDYILARTGLINGLFSGLWVGGNAIEKFLKTLILYSGKYSMKTMSDELKAIANNLGIKKDQKHNLHVCIELFKKCGFKLDGIPQTDIDLLAKFANERYPDNDNLLTSSTTGWYEKIDKMVYAIWENLKSINPDMFYTQGMNKIVLVYAMDHYTNVKRPAGFYHEMHLLQQYNQAYALKYIDVMEGSKKIVQARFPDQCTSS